jgi:hypothetical protein
MEVVKKVRLKRLGVQIGRTLKVWGRTSASFWKRSDHWETLRSDVIWLMN